MVRAATDCVPARSSSVRLSDSKKSSRGPNRGRARASRRVEPSPCRANLFLIKVASEALLRSAPSRAEGVISGGGSPPHLWRASGWRGHSACLPRGCSHSRTGGGEWTESTRFSRSTTRSGVRYALAGCPSPKRPYRRPIWRSVRERRTRWSRPVSSTTPVTCSWPTGILRRRPSIDTRTSAVAGWQRRFRDP